MVNLIIPPVNLFGAGGIAKRFSLRTAQIAYYLIIKRMLGSGFSVLGKLFTRLRRACAKAIMISCGERVTIEPMAVFNSECQIGSRLGIGKECIVGGKIIIDNDVMIGPNCSFGTYNHITERTDIPMNQQRVTKEEPIHIEDDVWLGERGIVLAGIRIGRGSVIGAGAVVSKDIPPYYIAVGNPARVVKSRLKN